MEIDCATEVWVATALLHQERPEQEGFKLQQIVDKAYSLGLFPRQRSGVVMEASQHAVATKSPSLEPNRYLTLVDGNLRRLFREGDEFHPGRRMGKVRPEPEEVPEEYRGLIAWYDGEYTVAASA